MDSIREIDHTVKMIDIIADLIDKIGNRRITRELGKILPRKPVKAKNINDMLNKIRGCEKGIGKTLKVWATIELTVCVWDCVDKVYDVF